MVTRLSVFFCSFVHSISVCRFYRFYFNWVLQSLQLLLCCCFQRFDCTLRITVLHTVKTTPTKTIKNIEPSKSFFFLLTQSLTRSLTHSIARSLAISKMPDITSSMLLSLLETTKNIILVSAIL